MVDNEDTISFGSETWNVADAFVKIKIFKPMYECDRCEMIAQYGIENMDEQVFIEEIPRRRIEALMRFKDNLRLIMENVNFIIRKDDRKDFEHLRGHLNFIEEILPAICKEERNYANHTIKTIINEEHFSKCLKALQKMKEDLHTPLNNCGIIFKQSDEMTFDELMEDIVDSG